MTLTFLFSQHPTLLLVCAGVLGALVGSFLNVVIYRLPIMLHAYWEQQLEEASAAAAVAAPGDVGSAFNLAVPRSHCPQCSQPLSALENIPVLSYLVLRGKCRHCRHPISLRYPATELITVVASVLVVANFGFSWNALSLLFLSWSLIVCALIDYDHHIIPDDVSLPLLWMGLLAATLGVGLPGISPSSAILGAAAGYLSLWSLYWAFRMLTGKIGMGHGDFKLLAALGAWLGWQDLLMLVLLSSVAGSAVGLVLILLGGRDRSVPLPYGPFLAAAGFITLIWGPQIEAFYFSLIAGY